MEAKLTAATYMYGLAATTNITQPVLCHESMTCNTTNCLEGMYGEDITMNNKRPLRDSSTLVPTDDATLQSGSQAARAVFDTVSLMLTSTCE
jgi:hypothetical protein